MPPGSRSSVPNIRQTSTYSLLPNDRPDVIELSRIRLEKLPASSNSAANASPKPDRTSPLRSGEPVRRDFMR